MAERITMNVDDTLELDYLVEQVSDDAIGVSSEPNNVSTSIDYISTKTGIFNPPDTGTYQLNINDQTIKIEVTDIPDSVVDDFEDENLTEYSGDTEDYSINTSSPITGTSDLEGGFSGSKPIIYSLEGNGLDYYPERGAVISCYLRDDYSASETANPGFLYGVAGSSGSLNGYQVNIGPFFSNFNMIRYDDGGTTFLLDKSPTLSNSQLYEIEVEWHDGTGSEVENTHIVNLYEVDSSLNRTSTVASYSVVDSTHSDNRGVGFVCLSGTQNGGGGYFDKLQSNGSVK